MNRTDDLLARRRRLYEEFGPAPIAASSDGVVALISGPVELGVTPGSFAVVEGVDDTRLVVQLRSARVVERDGPTIDLGDSITWDGAVSTHYRAVLRSIVGDAQVIGSLDVHGRFRSGTTVAFGERTVRPATSEEVAAIAEGLGAGQPAIEIGMLRQAPDVPAIIRTKGFARHTFICGQSGSGKTYTTGALFERLLADTELPMVVIDPNSDHVHLDELADPDARNPRADRYRSVNGDVAIVRGRSHGGTHVLRAHPSDLPIDVLARILRLDPIRELDEYHSFCTIVSGLDVPFSFDDVLRATHAADAAPLARRIENLGVAEWDLWCRPGEESVITLQGDGLRCMVIDVGSLATPDERVAVALSILANRWHRRQERQPVLLAIDEAHNLFPAHTDDPLIDATRAYGALIAGEGRKFGLHLFVASQRPAKMAENVLSQCDNLILMRMNGAADVGDLEHTFSHVAPELIRQSLSFRLGEALIAGPLSPVPTIAKIGTRITPEGGGDVPTTWTSPGAR